MSKISGFNRYAFITTGDNARYDDNQYYADYAAIDALPIKYEQVTYIAQDTGNRYRWDGASLILVVTGSGAVSSVSGGTDITITGTAVDPVVNVDNVFLRQANNLSDVTNVNTARTNLNVNNVPNVLENLTAIVDPTNNDDSGSGYSVGSRWINVNLNRAWTCVDATLGAAIWNRGVSLIGELDDVDTTGVQATNSLFYDGANWVAGEAKSTLDVSPSRIINLNLDALFNTNTEVQDSSDNALVGTLSNLGATNLVAGKFSNCIYFDDNNNLITFPYTSGILDFEHNAPWTVSLWMRTSNSNSTNRTILGSCEGANGSGWKLQYQSNVNRFEIQLSDNSSTRQLNVRWDIASAVNNNAWHHIAFVHRGGSFGYDDSSCDLYFDGVNQSAVKSVPNQTLLNTDSIISGQPFTVGGQASGGSNINDHYLDEICIFGFAMVDQSIKSVYNDGTGVTTYTSITSCLKCNLDQNDVVGLVNRLNTIETSNGPYVPALYEVDSAQSTTAKMGTNNNGTLSSATLLFLGKQPINVTATDYFSGFLEALQVQSYPFRVRCIEESTPADYVEFVITSSQTNHANAIQYTCVRDASNSTINTFVTSERYKVMIIPTQRSMAVGSSKLTVVENTTNETVTYDLGTVNGTDITTTGGGTYATGLTAQANINELDAALVSVSDKVTFLDGAFAVDASGNPTLDASPLTGPQYSITGSVLTIRSNVVVVGSTSLASNATVIIEGDFMNNGGYSAQAGSSLTTRGNVNIRGRDSTPTDLFSVNSTLFICNDEFSIRNYTSTVTPIQFNSTSGVCDITARTIVIENNNARILCANSGSGYTWKADYIGIHNNTVDLTDSATVRKGLEFYDMTMTANIIKFNENETTGDYCVSFNDSQLLSANIIEFNANKALAGANMDSFSDAVYFGNNNGLASADKITFYRNENTKTDGASGCSAVNFAPPCTLQSNLIEFIENVTRTPAAYAVDIQFFGGNSTLIKCECLKIVAYTSAPEYGTINNGTTDLSNLQSQYTTRGIPKISVYNDVNNPATITNIPNVGVQTEKGSRNTTPYADLHIHEFGAAALYVPAALSFNEHDSMNLNLASGATLTDSNVSFSLMGHQKPQRPLQSVANGKINTYYAIKLTGANWAGADLQYIRMGWATKTWLENVESNVSSGTNTYQTIWNTATTSNNRAYTMSFSGINGLMHVNNASSVSGRGGYTTDSLAAQNDVLVATFTNLTNGVILYWYNGTTQKSSAFITITSGSFNNNNFMNSCVVPYVNLGRKGTDWTIRFMSHREILADGISLPSNEPYMY